LATAFRLLTFLIALVPAVIPLGGSPGPIVGILSVSMLGCIGIFASSDEVRLAAQKTRFLRAAAIVPAVWMTIQLLPLPDNVANSIWRTAAPLLYTPAWGHITIDPGMTLSGLAGYVALASLSFATVFLASDRRRAIMLLEVMSLASTVAVLEFLALKYAGPLFGAAPSVRLDLLAATSILGLILAAATISHAIERVESRSGNPAKPPWVDIAIRTPLLAICLSGLISTLDTTIVFLAACGVGTFLLIQVIRRYSRSNWTTGALCLTATLAVAMISLWKFDVARPVSPFLQYATTGETVLQTQRILSDTGFAGIGAATYQAILPIYQGAELTAASAPTTASAFAIELGWLMTLVLAALSVGLIVVLIRVAIARRRDAVFSSAAAGCVVSTLAQTFCDASLLNVGVAAFIAVIIGLGFAQSRSDRKLVSA
jgi:hypothetical protein